MTFHSASRSFPVSELQLQAGIEWGGFQEHVHRPPIYANMVLVAGAFARIFPAAFPRPAAPVRAVRDGMANGDRRSPIALGPRDWAGIHGSLSTTPSIFGADGPLTDLVIFRWHTRDGNQAVGLNVWEPFTASVQTLHAIVSRLTAPQPPPTPRTLPAVAGIPMTSTPTWIHSICESAPLSRPACPTAVPLNTTFGGRAVVAQVPASGSASSIWISIEWFGPPTANQNPHPPSTGHFEITVGKIPTAAHDAPRIPIGQIKIPNGYVPTKPIPLGRRFWTPRPGRLIFGDCFANHLCYRWHDHRGYQIDLHAWYPITHTEAVLHAIVRSTPAARRTVPGHPPSTRTE